MEKWKNKKTIRGIIIGLIVVVTLVVAVVNTKITPAKSVGDTAEISREAGETSDGKKSSKKDEAGDSKKDSKDRNQEESDSDLEQGKEKDSHESVADGGQSSQDEITVAVDNGSGQQNGSSAGATTGKEPAQSSPNGSNSQNASLPAKNITCSIAITCDAISGNGKLTSAGHPELEPYAANANILGVTTYTVKEGTSAYDILKQACDANGIQIDATYNSTYNTSYVRGINYLYEFSAGPGSGWMYQVNGVSPNRGASSYKLSEGDVVTWYYVAR